MSWSKSQTPGAPVAIAWVTILGLTLTSCAQTPLEPIQAKSASSPANPTYDPKAATPLGHYRAALEELDGQIALAPHPSGTLSEAQKAALKTLVTKVADLSDGAFVIRIAGPDPENGDSAITAQSAAEQLRQLGVPPERITFGRYVAAQRGGPIQISYSAAVAVGPNCKKGWDDFSATGQNDVTRHFGCATASNLAAMIADPRDLERPAAETSADATRRMNILNKYRKGETTSSSKDEQASGTVSQAVK